VPVKRGAWWRPRGKYRSWILLGLAVVTAAAAVAVFLGVVYPRVGAWYVRSRVIPRLERKLGRSVQVAEVEVGLGHVQLRGIRVYGGPLPGNLAAVQRVEVDFDWKASLLGSLELGDVRVHHAQLWLHRDRAGVDNVRDVIDRVSAGRDTAAGVAPGSGVRPRRVQVLGIGIFFRDERQGLVVTAGLGRAEIAADRSAYLQLSSLAWSTGLGIKGQGSVRIEKKANQPPTAQLIGGVVELWPRLALTGIAATLTPGEEAGSFRLDMAGGYGGVEGTLWTAKGWVVPATQSAEIALAAEQFSLQRLEPILQGSSVVNYQDTTVDAELSLHLDPEVLTFAGGFHVRDLTVGHPLLAEQNVQDLDLSATLSGSVDRASRRFRLDRGDLVARDLAFQLTGEFSPAQRDLVGVTTQAPRLNARLVVPQVECQRVHDAIPAEMAPYLGGYRLKGKFAADLQVAIDWADLDHTALDGTVGIRGCRVVAFPEDSPNRLLEEFEHYVEVEQDQWISFVVGPSNPDFVPLAEVSPYLIGSLMTTEDSAFYDHHGFIVREFQSALIKNLKAGYFKYGASSITMQLVKNALLYREKTLARKLQELFLTWYIEQVLDKDRILEIYVNIIEYGPGLYGIGPAAMHYFGKHPRDLNPVEAAFFSSILPGPKQRYKQYCEGAVSKWTEDKMTRILELMFKRGRLTTLELDQSRATPLVFFKDGVESEKECLARWSKAIRNARPTNPLKKSSVPVAGGGRSGRSSPR
jgi:hypothetical protein